MEQCGDTGSIPPADINPHLGLVSRVSPRSGRHCSRPGGRPGVHGSVLRRQRPAEPAGSAGRGAGLCGASCVSRTAQVMGLFDLSPSSGPFREVPEGPPQVSKRPTELVQHCPAGSTFIRGGSWHSEAHAQTRQARPAARRGQPNAIPRHPQALATGHGCRGPCAGQTLDHQ